MTQRKNGIFMFHCIFEFFGARGTYYTKKKKKHPWKFFALNFGTFQAFLTCLDMFASVSVLRNFEMLQHLTIPTKP